MPYAVHILPLPPPGLLNLRATESARVAFDAALGLTLPRAANTSVTAGPRTACWLGPNEWLLLTEETREHELETSLREALGEHHGAVTVVSDAYAAIEIAGPQAREVLDQGTSIDTHPEVFRPGACARVKFAKTQVLLLHREGPDAAYWIFVPRSYAAYLLTWLERARGA